MTCFKRIDKSAEVFYRRKKLGDGQWRIATQKDINNNGSMFVDIYGQKHLLDNIANAGFSNDGIFPLYLYNGFDKDGNQLYCFTEVDKENAEIVKKYINNNICSE